MLEDFSTMLKIAKKNHCAIPHFNINNLEWAKYILEKCQSLNVPVILGVSISASNYMGGWSVPVAFTKALIKEQNITIPVCLHVDHGNLEECKKAIDAGFKSVMIDASMYSLEENIRITQEVVRYAQCRGVSVEAEIGSIKNTTDEIGTTCLDDCLTFYKDTSIDALAPAIGNAHGVYTKDPKLDFELLKKLSTSLPIPLVLHGGSGINEDQIKDCISLGICKININTDLQLEWSKGVRYLLQQDSKVYDPRKIIASGKANMDKKITDLVLLFKTKLVTDFFQNNTI